MDRTTILIPTQLKKKAEKRAVEIGVSLGEFIRLSLDAMLKSTNDKSDRNSFFKDNDFYLKPVPSDLSKNHDFYLYGDEN